MSINLSNSDVVALKLCGLLRKELTPELVEQYSNYTWTPDDLLRELAISKSVRNRLYLKDTLINEHGQWYCPLHVARYIQALLKKRGKGENLQDFAFNVMDHNRRKTQGHRTSRFSNQRKLEAVVQVIHRLTRGKDNARSVFERELAKIGVYLPKE